MKCCVVEDTSFIVATIDGKDPFHNDAVFVFRELLKRKDGLQIIIPPLVLYEVIVTLKRKGVSQDRLESTIMRLVNIQNTTVLSLSELSALKHAKSLLNINDQTKALRTSDFLIASLAVEFEALILTFDKTMWQRCEAAKLPIFYCSGNSGMDDETSIFIEALDHNISSS